MDVAGSAAVRSWVAGSGFAKLDTGRSAQRLFNTFAHKKTGSGADVLSAFTSCSEVKVKPTRQARHLVEGKGWVGSCYTRMIS